MDNGKKKMGEMSTHFVLGTHPHIFNNIFQFVSNVKNISFDGYYAMFPSH